MHFSLDASRIRFPFSQNIHAKIRMNRLWRHLLLSSSEAAQIYVDLKWVAQMIHHPYEFGSQIRLKLIVVHFFTTLWSWKSSNPFKQISPFLKTVLRENWMTGLVKLLGWAVGKALKFKRSLFHICTGNTLSWLKQWFRSVRFYKMNSWTR